MITLLTLLACTPQVSVTKLTGVIAAAPAFQALGDVPVSTDVPFTIDLTSTRGGDVHVKSVEVQAQEGKGFSFSDDVPTVPEGGTASLNLHFYTDSPGSDWARIVILSDASDAELTVDVSAHAVQPSADVSPLELDFGAVTAGSSTTANVKVTNTGTLDLSLVGGTFGDSAWSIGEALPVAIPVGTSAEVPLVYLAPDDLSRTSTVILDLGAAGLPAVHLRVNDCVHGDPSAYDVDGDGVTSCGGDCADADADVHPGAVEVCDGVDQDCDGAVDDGTTCSDNDGDGYSVDDGDCNDDDAKVHPGAIEDLSNGYDDDCDGIVDAGTNDIDGDGYAVAGGDCDDGNADVRPGEPEQADGMDQDCDGIVDEGSTNFDDDGDGVSEAAGDCDDGDAAVSPGSPEVADRRDDDCDGTVDEGTSGHDDDGDGFTEDGGDCDDANGDVSPAMLEVDGNGVDDDCDGLAL